MDTSKNYSLVCRDKRSNKSNKIFSSILPGVKCQMLIKILGTQTVYIISRQSVWNACQSQSWGLFNPVAATDDISDKKHIHQALVGKSSGRQQEEEGKSMKNHRSCIECIHWGDNAWLPWIIKSSSLHGLSWQRHIQVHSAWTAPNCLQL